MSILVLLYLVRVFYKSFADISRACNYRGKVFPLIMDQSPFYLTETLEERLQVTITNEKTVNGF